MVIDGRKIASEILDDLTLRVQKLKERGITPTLAIILVGDNPQSTSYIKQKELKGNRIGVKTSIYRFPNSISTKELVSRLNDLNHLSTVHGIIVQRPLPSQISESVIDSAVNPKKDIDGFHPDSKFHPPIALAVIKILNKADPNFLNKKITVIGKGQTGGAPIIKDLIKLGAFVNVIDRQTTEKEKKEILKNSDIVISAVGKSLTVTSKLIKKGAILLSVGLHKDEDEKMHGDYNEDDIKNIVSFYTPTPGGVGPVNVACLLSNLVKSAEYGNR